MRKLLLLFCLVLPLRASAELLRDSAVYDGVTREWFVHVPSGNDGSRPLPLVIALHGSGGSGDRFSALTGWTDVADDGQFLAVFPTAAPPQNIWNIYFLIEKPDDVSWLLRLISILQSKYSIDSTRIYMTGFSNGTAMTNTFWVTPTIRERARWSGANSFRRSTEERVGGVECGETSLQARWFCKLSVVSSARTARLCRAVSETWARPAAT